MRTRTNTWIAGVMMAAIVGTGASGDTARADIIELKDGRKIVGTMVRKEQAMVITRDTVGGGALMVAPEDVVRVTLTTSLTEADWARTAMDLKKAPRFAEYLALLEEFSARHPETPTGAQARKLAAAYEAMAGQDPIRFRGEWMPRALVEVIENDAAAKVRPAVTLYKAGKLKEALDAANDGLAVDDSNATALSLVGLINYRLNNLQESRNAFLQLVAAAPSNVLGWNNLAVVAFGLKRQQEGLGFYTKALQVGPDKRMLLDNVIEAMHAYGGSKLDPAYTDLERQFAQAEAAMETQAAREGLFRFGSIWLAREPRDQLVAAKATLEKNESALEAQYEQAVHSTEESAVQIKQAQADYDAALNEANYWTLRQIAPASGGANVEPTAQSRRDAAMADLERTKKKKAALEDQQTQAAKAVKQTYADVQKIKGDMARAESQGVSGVQRLMELGDDTPPTVAAPKVGGEAPPVHAPEPVFPLTSEPAPPAPVTDMSGAESPALPVYPVYPEYPRRVHPPIIVVPPAQTGPIIMPPWGGPIIVPPAPVAPPPAPAPPPPAPKGKPRYYDGNGGG